MNFLKRIPGRLIFAVTALAVAVLCLVRLFVPALWVGVVGVSLSLIFAFFRHGARRLSDTADEAAKELEKSAPEEEQKP